MAAAGRRGSAWAVAPGPGGWMLKLELVPFSILFGREKCNASQQIFPASTVHRPAPFPPPRRRTSCLVASLDVKGPWKTMSGKPVESVVMSRRGHFWLLPWRSTDLSFWGCLWERSYVNRCLYWEKNLNIFKLSYVVSKTESVNPFVPRDFLLCHCVLCMKILLPSEQLSFFC